MPDDPARPLKPVHTLQYYSRSLSYGIAVLERFVAAQPALQLSELADMAELSRSTAHRYAMTLVALGYLEQDGRRRYRLARTAAAPGMAAIETMRLETPAARAILADLRTQTGHTVSMGALEGNRVIYLHRLLAHGAGQYAADLNLGVGAHVPVHCTAIGKALLASLAEPEQYEILEDLVLNRAGPNTIMSIRALADELTHARAAGVAVCDEEQARGVRSIAAATPHPGRSRPLAVSVTVPAQLYPIQKMTAKLGPPVRAAAERI